MQLSSSAESDSDPRIDEAVRALAALDVAAAAALIVDAIRRPHSVAERAEAVELLQHVGASPALERFTDADLLELLRDPEIDRQQLGICVWPRVIDRLNDELEAGGDATTVLSTDLVRTALGTIVVDEPSLEERLGQLHVYAAPGGWTSSWTMSTDFSGEPANQYGAAPYPYWRDLPRLRRRHLGRWFRHSPWLVRVADGPQPPERPSILIAGCGTGRHAMRTARRMPDASIAAVDVSFPSLALAAEHGARHPDVCVQLAQSDVSALPFPDDRFDLVECVGVLHHIRQRDAAYQELVRVARPNASLCIGVYSRSARAAVHAARAEVGHLRVDPSAARRVLLGLPDSHPAAAVRHSPDFASAAGFLDLLFPAFDSDYTPDELRAELDRNGLRVWAIEVDHPAVATLATQLGAGRSWDGILTAVESVVPHAFAAMYLLWCVPSEASTMDRV